MMQVYHVKESFAGRDETLQHDIDLVAGMRSSKRSLLGVGRLHGFCHESLRNCPFGIALMCLFSLWHFQLLPLQQSHFNMRSQSLKLR